MNDTLIFILFEKTQQHDKSVVLDPVEIRGRVVVLINLKKFAFQKYLELHFKNI